MEGWTFPENLKSVAEQIGPDEIAIFHGEIDPDELGLPEKFAIKNVKAPTGDFRAALDS